MKVSSNGLDIIKKWEGCQLEAYRCPANVWTIGWGTTRYPNGNKVREGDAITQEKADGFLCAECQEKARSVSDLVRVDLNQNQFDALVSFTYNVGSGAFQASTLLRKLNSGDYKGAANEFKQWNKITTNGKKVVSQGLVNRRKDEETLFSQVDNFGEPIDLEPSPQHSVTWLEGYRTGENTVVVAYKGDRVVEVIELKTSLKEDLIDLLQQYPKAKKFHFAPVDKEIPKIDRIIYYGRQVPRKEGENLPKLNRGLLVQGMSDEDESGHDIRELQTRLQELGYYRLEIDGIFGTGTDNAVKDFQADAFGSAEADGKVGTLTWKALWSESPIESSSDKSKYSLGTYLQLTKTNRKDRFGCYVLMLEYIKDGKLEGQLEVCSGQPHRQYFRTGPKSKAGSMEPLPEGKWYINDILWAGGKDKYNSVVFNQGLGPVSTPVKYLEPKRTGRSGIEIHIDWNRHTRCPGTAGCIGMYDVADYKKFVSWLRDTDPRDLYVNWGLGTCPKP